MSRGDRREDIVYDEVDRQESLKTLAEACQKADFRQGLLERIGGKLGEHHAGQLRGQSASAKAERIIGEELQRRGWTRADLEERDHPAPEPETETRATRCTVLVVV